MYGSDMTIGKDAPIFIIASSTSLLRYRVRLLEFRIFDSECSLRVFKPSIYRDYRVYLHLAFRQISAESVIEKLTRFDYDILVSYVRGRHYYSQERGVVT